MKELGSQLDGLSGAEAGSRLKQFGANEIAREKRQSALMRLLSNVKNPLVLLLLALAALSYLTGDLRATAVILVMVVLIAPTIDTFAGSAIDQIVYSELQIGSEVRRARRVAPP